MKMTRLTATLSGALASILAIAQASASDVMLHRDANCQGPSMSTIVATPDVNYPVDSVKVIGGPWEICRDTNYRNCVRVDRDGCSNLTEINFWGQVRSVRPAASGPSPVKPEAILYRDIGFSGPAVAIPGAKSDMSYLDNFRARSIRVKGGAWEVCSGKNYKGRCRKVENDTANLMMIGVTREIGSMRPLDAAPPASVFEAAFHVQNQCRGPAYSTTIAASNINYPMRSIEVVDGSWEVCNRENFGGVCRTVNKGCHDLIAIDFAGLVRSARPATPKPQPR